MFSSIGPYYMTPGLQEGLDVANGITGYITAQLSLEGNILLSRQFTIA